MLSIFILIMIVITVVIFSTVVMKRKNESNNANRFFSVSSMTEKLLLMIKRFPISILLVVGLAILFFIAVNNKFDDIQYRLWIFFSVGAFISVTVTLFSEDFFKILKTYGISIFAVLLWGVNCFFLPEKSDDIHIGKWIEISVISGSVFLAMLFISFLKKDKDRAFWNFATQTLFQMALAGVFGLILFGGLSLALFAIHSLFNVSVDDKFYQNLAVICFVLFTPHYFLANIPNHAEKHDEDLFYPKVLKILALYILTPILAVYSIILYAYLFKIVAAWELPNGWVSWLVSALALGGLLVIAFLYPIREQEKSKVVKFISRWFGLFILPLLALMTIGIFRRIGDYGITINRGYILLLNLWFYGIYIYLFCSLSRHIKWILISLVVVALVSSMNVWGIANFTKKSLTKEVSKVLTKQVSSEEAKLIFAKMTPQEKERIKSALEYLSRNFGKESVQPFFTDTISNSYLVLSELGLSSDLAEKVKRISYNRNNDKEFNIEGYTTFTQINYNAYNKARDNSEHSLIKDTIEISVPNRTFFIPIREITLEYLSTEENLRDEKEWVVRGNDYTVLFSHFYGNYYPVKDSVSISNLGGYLFYK